MARRTLFAGGLPDHPDDIVQRVVLGTSHLDCGTPPPAGQRTIDRFP
jgi:hypothetical protein